MTDIYSETQRAILSIILNYGNEAFDVAGRLLEERHFTENRYKLMWRAIKWLFDHGHEITEITTEQSLLVTRDSSGQVAMDLLDPRTGKHKEELLAIKEYRSLESISHLQSYIDIILDKFKVAKYLSMSDEIQRLAKNGKATAGQIHSIVTKYSEFFNEQDRKQPRTLVDIAKILVEKNKSTDSGDQSVIHTDIPMIDNFIWLTPGNQTVIAGDTAHGKTSLALQIAWNVAKQRKKVINPDTGKPELDDNGNEIWTHRRVLFFSLEMSSDEILTKLCCIENNIPAKKFMVEMSPKEKIDMLNKFMKQVELVAPFFMIDHDSFSLKEITQKTTMVHSMFNGIDLVVWDYLQLIEEVKEGGFRREDEVYRTVSRSLKKLEKKLEFHGIPLSQLNKAPSDKNGVVNHRPTLDRLFGSSALKQDASHVIFVYREWSVEIKRTVISGEDASTYFINRIILAKHRFGYNQVEIVAGFIPYATYFVPLKTIRDLGILKSNDTEFVFPKIQEFMQAQ